MCPFHHFFAARAGINLQIAQSLESVPRQITGVGGIAVQYYNIHNVISILFDFLFLSENP